ncbi:MAG: nitroreductase family protein [Flavobacteriales bacterium]|jgi:nitroreductase|nr:nitroreductase family protein [Flavobacteriales bacterium]
MKSTGVQRSALPVHPVLNARFSPRAFSDRAVTDAELELVLEAARWAPSSMNEQPWRFLITRRGEEGHAELLATLNHSNQVWANKAPVLILNLVHRILSRIGQENFHARHDLGIATAQLTAQATALGMGLHILGGFHADAARAAFGIPETYDVVSVIVLGFPGEPDSLPEQLMQRELQHSPRRPLAELVHYGRFNG